MNGWPGFAIEPQHLAFFQDDNPQLGQVKLEESIDGSIVRGLNQSSNFERTKRGLK